MMLHPVTRPLAISGFYSFFDYCCAKDYYFEGEHHHFWEVAYCLDRTVGISADEKIYRLHPGDLVVYRPYVHHKQSYFSTAFKRERKDIPARFKRDRE